MASKRKAPQNRSSLLLALARQVGIRDPRAVLSVAAQEGLSGGIGDSGTSFGPFQLHVGGAFPAHIQGNRQAWAWSRPGLLYALSRIKNVAGNLQGEAAINAIVRRFERPAAPGQEIAKALAHYRGGGGMPVGDAPLPVFSAGGAGGSVPNLPDRRQILQQTLMQRGDLLDALRQIQTLPQPSAPPLAPRLGAPPRTAPPGPGGLARSLAELFYDPMGGIKLGKQIGPIGGHQTHVHAAYTNPRALLAALAYAQKLGLRVSENPYVEHVDPVHAKHSYHYRTFPGRYNGKRLGEAFDASGSPAAMRALYQYLSRGVKH